MEAEKKTFSDLEKEVQEPGLCGKCGGCVSFCSADRLGALKVGPDGRPTYEDKEKCLECGICYLICPRTKDLDEEVKDKFGWQAPMGPYQFVTSVRTTDSQVQQVCTDGGVVTSVLMYMLEQNLVQGALVSKRTGLLARKPVIATSKSDLIRAAGSDFAESGLVEQMGEEYTTYTQIIPALRGLEIKHFGSLAVVGTPCQIMTLKKMQVLKILPSDVVAFTIGLFCMENFSFQSIVDQPFAKERGIRLEDVQKLNIKEYLIVTMKSGTTYHIPFEEVDEIARPACLACQDFANDYADISVGGLASPDGYTTTLVRTDLGKRMYTEALRQGYIEERTAETPDKTRAERDAVLQKVIAFAETKRERGAERLKQVGVTE